MVAAMLGFMVMGVGPALADTDESTVWTKDFEKAFRTEKMMHMMDKSGKGMVSKADFMKHMEMMFDMMDKNHDGMLDKKEFMYGKVLPN